MPRAMSDAQEESETLKKKEKRFFWRWKKMVSSFGGDGGNVPACMPYHFALNSEHFKGVYRHIEEQVHEFIF